MEMEYESKGRINFVINKSVLVTIIMKDKKRGRGVKWQIKIN